MWHYECNGQPVGPVSEEAVRILIRDGVLARSTLVWKSGMSAWANAGETDLFCYFETPPPLAPKVESEPKAIEQSLENKSPRSEREEPSGASGAGYAAVSGGLTETTVLSPPPSKAVKRPYEVSAGTAKPLAGMVGHAQVAVIAFSLVSAVAVVSDLASISFIDQTFSGYFEDASELDRRASAVDAFSQYAGIAYSLALAWSAIVVGRWTYRAMKNLREMGLETTVSPGWAVGWYFIPIALLWMPFRGMAQIWRGSVHGAPLGDSRLPALMRVWWACWLVGNWLSFAAFRTQETGLTTEDFGLVQTAMGIGIVGSTSHIISAAFLLTIMKKVSRAQSDQPPLQFS